MTNKDTYLRSLLSPSRAGTLFAPFRSRSANPEGFDSKMKLWICAIEEWAVVNKKLTLSLKDIHNLFVSDAGIRPDKECVRLVLSEMKRRSRIVTMSALKTSRLWSPANTSSFIDSYIDSKGWIGWGVKNFVYNPASWAVSTLRGNENQCYSDLTDMSITDAMVFVCQKSLDEISMLLNREIIRISKAEKQCCFEWQHLLELVMPIVGSIVDATNGAELLDLLDILIDYLAMKKRITIQIDGDTKLVKVASDDSNESDLSITKKDIAIARLLKAKELLLLDIDKYHTLALKAKQEALESFNRKEVARAKSQLRSHKRLENCVEQKESQLTNVEIMLDQLETTTSNMVILQAYKDGAEALKIANTRLDNNQSVLDDLHDVTAEAHYLNDEMNRILKDISSQRSKDISQSELEAELDEFLRNDPNSTQNAHVDIDDIVNSKTCTSNLDILDELQKRINNLTVCHDESETINESQEESLKKTAMHATSN